MILKKLAEAIEKSGRSRYQIWQDTRIDQAVLHRIMNGGSCSIETVERLCDYLGLELAPKKRKKRGK